MYFYEWPYCSSGRGVLSVTQVTKTGQQSPATGFPEAEPARQRREPVDRLTRVDLVVLEDFRRKLRPTVAGGMLGIPAGHHYWILQIAGAGRTSGGLRAREPPAPKDEVSTGPYQTLIVVHKVE